MTQVLGLTRRSAEYSPLLPSIVGVYRFRPVCGVMHCNPGNEVEKKGLANACLYEILGSSSPSMRLQPSLDKTRHPNKKEQEITLRFEDNVRLITQS